MKALYRLSSKIAGFDFFPWLVMQRAAGADEVIFDTRNPSTGKWPHETVMRRFHSILFPGPALLGMKASIGIEGVSYASMSDAARALDCSYSKIYRLIGERWRYEKRARVGP